MGDAPRLLRVLTDNKLMNKFNLSATDVVRIGHFRKIVRAMPGNKRSQQKENYPENLDVMNYVPDHGVLVDMTKKSPNPFEEDQQRDRFDKQLEMLASLRHPCVLTEVTPFVCPRYFSLVLSFKHRVTLQRHIMGEAYSSEVAIPIFVDMAAGLTFLHRRKIVHLGLDLTTFLVDSDGRAVITGFSRALQVNSPLLNIEPGWPTVFHAPELDEDQGPVDPFKVDSYALGAVLYCLLHETVDIAPRNLLYLWCIYGGNDFRYSGHCDVHKCFWNPLVNLLQHHPLSRWGDLEVVKELHSVPEFTSSGSRFLISTPLSLQ